MSNSELNDLALSLMDTGKYFIFNRNFVLSGKLSKLEALFLQDLINLGGMSRDDKLTITEDDHTYFLCTSQYLENSLLWDADTQTKLLKALREKGLVSVIKKGLPARRYVSLMADEIVEVLLSQSRTLYGTSPVLKTGKEKESDSYESSSSKRKRRTLIPDNSTLKNTNGSDIDRKLALSLHNGLLAKNKIVRDVGPVQLGKWAKHFTELRKYRTVKEIQTAIDFHVLHIGESYHPDYRSAKKFCSLNPDEGFVKIEAAMERAENTRQEDQVKKRKQRESEGMGW